MKRLFNRVNNRELKARLEQSKEQRITLSFYKYHQLENPQAFRDDLYLKLSECAVLGRIYVANEGINGQMSVPTEQFVIDAAVKAGFRLVGKAEINANPKDTKDYPDGVWTLPPTLKLGDQDKARFLAIGESDRMTLKFVKP